MTRDANVWIGILLFAFSLGLLPGLVPPQDPNPELRRLAEYSVREMAPGDVETVYRELLAQERSHWLQNVGMTILSALAIWLTLVRKKAGLWCVALVCLLMLFVYVPPLIPEFISGRFFQTASLVVFKSASSMGLRGLIGFWHLVVAPFAYLLLGIAATAIAVRRQRATVR